MSHVLPTACVWTCMDPKLSPAKFSNRVTNLQWMMERQNGPQEQRMLRNLGGVAPHLIDRGQERLVPSPWFKRWRPNWARPPHVGFHSVTVCFPMKHQFINSIPIGSMVLLYMETFTINIPQMLAYIPYMDPMGYSEGSEAVEGTSRSLAGWLLSRHISTDWQTHANAMSTWDSTAKTTIFPGGIGCGRSCQRTVPVRGTILCFAPFVVGSGEKLSNIPREPLTRPWRTGSWVCQGTQWINFVKITRSLI